MTQKLLYKYLKYSKRKCLVVRRIGNSLKDSVFALFKSTISNWNIYNDCKINKTDLTIELPNGSSFIFKGLDDEERLKSIADIDDIWIEEATEIDDFKFDQLCLRLRSKKPYNQVFVSFNPISKENWVYKRWFREDADYNEDTTNVLKTTYKDNRFLPQSYIDNLMDMKRNNPAYFEIYANGEFASLDKLIYTNWKVKTFDYIQILKEVKDSKAIFNLDFGYTNDPTAFGAEILDEVNKRIWIFDGFEEKGLLNDEIAQNIIKMGYGKEVITCDSAEPKSIEELRRNGLSRVRGAVKGKDSIINGINLLQQYEIIVHPKLTWVIEELKNYTWKKGKDGEYINVPIDKYNHSLDSLRYGVTTEIGVKKITLSFFDRSALF
ncbi:MAG: PBSX family phage terminase large subunit [Clostridium sp.]|nr:PBSX family phage terminase large subunit [Clostridium sp.]